jgi:SAM-dependent methyltransferase
MNDKTIDRESAEPVSLAAETIQREDAHAEPLWGLAALEARREVIRQIQAKVTPVRARWIANNRYFYDAIRRILRFIIESDRKVLSVRCQTGFLLDSVDPAHGVGVEVSQEMVELARKTHPRFEFIQDDPEDLEVVETFDYVLFDQVSDTIDVLEALRKLKSACDNRTRLVIYTYNHFWRPIIHAAEFLGLKVPMTEQNWLSEEDLRNLLTLAGFEWLRTYRTVLCPKWIPLVSEFLNRLVTRIPVIDRLCMINILVARPAPRPRDPDSVSVSVIVPCKNERGNIESAVRRIPDMGSHTEILFCDDQSTDGTADEVRRMQRAYPDRDIRLIDGPGICKAENVWTGFRAARGDVLMILDADLTVIPEELPAFFRALVEGRGEFINGSRLVYPMQKGAMKPANMVGNKFFSLAFSYLLGQTIKDTLCGTKVLWRTDWERIEPMLGSWGVADRWGDYELLFGAAKLHLRIVDMPVHYQERIYGTTKMVKVFRNGLIMLRMCLASFLKLKLGY